jgi:tetratricopeptide (TPR) repeat protein
VAQVEQESLVDRLARYPVERYPVQHATTQFHLGSALLHTGQAAPALAALSVARDVFTAAGMQLETGKATLMQAIALRAAGRPEEAVTTFRTAGELLAPLDQPVEQAAVAYNLGLVLQDLADHDGAHAAWTRARELFLAAGYPAQAGAAARDHGASLLTRGDVAGALPLLEQAAALAERAGDDSGTAAAANVLGLAHLAAQDPAAAVGVLRRALAFVPRTVRPADHAMVKANLALAHEQAGDRARARLAALQAGAVSSAAAPVRAQAQEVLSRLPGRPADDLLTVLDDEDREQWDAVVREEVLRAVDLPDAGRCAVVSGFLDGVLARPESSYTLAETLLGVVIELPPRSYSLLVEALVAAFALRPEDEAERLQAVLSSAMARFAMPQWQRLAASLNTAAQASGQPATWR